MPDRRGGQRFRCGDCRGRCTATTGTPCAGYRFPPDVIALAVRRYLRFRLSYADVAERLAERGVGVDASSVDAWARESAPLYEEAARAFRHAVGGRWSVDETYVTIAGEWAYVYRAIDAREQRAGADAAACFRRAVEATGVVPVEVTTDRAAAYPPALSDVLPTALHETGKAVQQRIEREHQHRKGRLGSTRGFKTRCGARILCAGQAFLRNLRGGFYDLVPRSAAAPGWSASPVCQIGDTLTAVLLGCAVMGISGVDLARNLCVSCEQW